MSFEPWSRSRGLHRFPQPDKNRHRCYDRSAMAANKIDVEHVRHVARLARMELSPDEEQSLLTDLSAILSYVDKLNELDTSTVEPTTQVGEARASMREDEVTNRPAPD